MLIDQSGRVRGVVRALDPLVGILNRLGSRVEVKVKIKRVVGHAMPLP